MYLEFRKDNEQQVVKQDMVSVRNGMEEEIRQLLCLDYAFVENNAHTDRNLMLGYVASILAIGGAVYGFMHPFQDGVWLLIPCCIGYYLCSLLLTISNRFWKKNTVFQGKSSKETIQVDMETNKYSDKIVIIVYKLLNGKLKQTARLDSKVGKFVTSDGFISARAVYDLINPLMTIQKLE